MDAEKIEELKGLVHSLKLNPSALNTPALAFFKDFLESLGARVPSSDKSEAEAASVFKDGEIIKILSASDLKVKLNAASKTSRLTIIYFTAAWCGPCRYISPVYSSLAGEYPKVVFLKVDIDEAMAAAAEWNVSSIPCFFFLKNGKVVDEYVGTDNKSLEQKIGQHAG